MKDELIARIGAAQRRQKIVLLALIFVFIPLAGGVALFFAAEAHQVTVYPKLAQDARPAAQSTDGVGFMLGRQFLLFSRAATVTFSYPNHSPISVQVVKNDGSDVISGILAPLPKTISASTQPPIEGSWFLNRVFMGKGFGVELTVFPGSRYNLEFVGPYGRSRVTELEPDTRLSLKENLKVDVSDWAISLDSDPSEALVASKGRLLGTTPLTLLPSSASQVVVISKQGYRSSQVDLAAQASYKTDQLVVTLQQEGERLPAVLSPADGELTGATLANDGSAVVLSGSLPVVLTYSKQGYVPQNLTVESTTKRVLFKLQRASGTLYLTGPSKATLSINGKGTYAAPISVDLPVGKTTVTIAADGYKSQKRQVSIYQDKVTELSPSLETLAAYQIRTAPDRIAADGNIYLVKIKPDRVTLGAPRNQRGQRANEIIREVELARQFYIGETEVSEAQYAKFAGGAASSNLPMVGVSWQDAAKFSNYLSAQENLDPFYIVRNNSIVGWNPEAIGYRLPTEAEWEYVASRHTKRREQIFTWGDKFKIPEAGFGNIADKSADGVAEIIISDRSDGYSRRAPVGSSRQVGSIADISGNVSEWVHDYYSISLPTELVLTDYLGPRIGRQHFVKGSNYFSSSWTELRVSYREPIDGAREDVGFRVARYVY